MELNERMAALFEKVDLVIAAANPDVAFAAEGPLPKIFDGVEASRGNNGRLTFPANLFGCPAVSIPAGAVEGLPVGLQITARHFSEPLLLELAAIVEQERPWPLVAPRPPA
jgi:aspartyl-tRNA(Asn)/glutamyl-tRNA(Gln) amidotransferase subunit A